MSGCLFDLTTAICCRLVEQKQAGTSRRSMPLRLDGRGVLVQSNHAAVWLGKLLLGGGTRTSGGGSLDQRKLQSAPTDFLLLWISADAKKDPAIYGAAMTYSKSDCLNTSTGRVSLSPVTSSGTGVCGPVA